MYSAFEILGLAVLALAVLWLAFGAPGAVSGFMAVLSPFDAWLQASKKAEKISKDETYPLVTRLLAAAFAKIGAGFVLAMAAVIVAFFLFARFGKLLPRFHIM